MTRMIYPDCWLCEGLGGIAIHNHWSEQRGKTLWTAHKPESDTHPVKRCPLCELRNLPKTVTDRRSRIKLEAHVDEFDPPRYYAS